jgi:hypothetical protein
VNPKGIVIGKGMSTCREWNNSREIKEEGQGKQNMGPGSFFKMEHRKLPTNEVLGIMIDEGRVYAFSYLFFREVATPYLDIDQKCLRFNNLKDLSGPPIDCDCDAPL